MNLSFSCLVTLKKKRREILKDAHTSGHASLRYLSHSVTLFTATYDVNVTINCQQYTGIPLIGGVFVLFYCKVKFKKRTRSF